METVTMKPLKTTLKLAASQGLKPKYFKTVKLNSGVELKVADPQITRGLLALMDAQAFLGGAASHWGGPAALSELMSALYGYSFFLAEQKKQKWFECLQIVNDAGHCENGIYALKANYNFAGLKVEDLKGFRSITSPLTGHGEAHLFPEGVYISNGPLGSSLPQAQGLSLADKRLGVATVTVTVISDGACMEGEARESLAAIPGLASRGLTNPFIMVISDNNTKLSGRIDEQSFSMQPTFKSLSDLGWKVIKLDEPHDLQKSLQAVEEAYNVAVANPKVPVAIHAKTIKGYGLKHSEHSKDGGHGFHIKAIDELNKILEEIFHGQPMPDELKAWRDEVLKTPARKLPPSPVAAGQPTEKVQVGVSKALITARKKGLPIINVTSDLPGSTGTASFQKEFPQDWLDVGVAESNMISVAAGLSKQGFIPVVDTFSQFGVTKGALPLTMASLSEAPVIAIFSHAGFQDAADGASHQALCYIAMTSALPYTKVIVLSTSGEAEALVGQAIEEFANARNAGKTPNSYLFFLGRENFPQHYTQNPNYKLGSAQVIIPPSTKASGVTLVAAGPLVHQALEAELFLKSKGINCAVINASTVNTPDAKTVFECLQKTNHNLITIEDHQVIGGMGANLVQKLMNDIYSSSSDKLRAKCLGVKGTFGQSAHQAIDLYKKHGLDSESIAKAAMELIK